MNDSYFQLLIYIVFAVSLGEAVADVAWLSLYFRHGIPLYVRKVIGTLPNRRHDLMDLVSCSQTKLSFHRLSPHEVAFRDSWLTLRISVMHGRVVLDGSGLQITGLANWRNVAFGIFFFYVSSIFLIHEPIFAILMLAAFICLYAWGYDLQRQDFDKLIVELSAQLKPPA